MSSSLSFLVLTMIGLPELVNLKEVDPRVELDIRYATKDNFTHQQLYEVAKCYLRPVVAKMVRKSQDYLERTAPGKRLLVKDCYRPVSVHVDTEGKVFVADCYRHRVQIYQKL